MQKMTVIMLLGMSMILASCGSNSHAAGNINGQWAATLSNSSSNMFAFNTTLTVNADGSSPPK